MGTGGTGLWQPPGVWGEGIFLQENKGWTLTFPVRHRKDRGVACSPIWDGSRQSLHMPQDCWNRGKKPQFIAIYELKEKVYFKVIEAILNVWLLLAFPNTSTHCLPVSLGYKPSVFLLEWTHSCLGCHALQVSTPKYFSRALNGLQGSLTPLLPPAQGHHGWVALCVVGLALVGTRLILALIKSESQALEN